VNKEKMSKSTGNFFRLAEAFEQAEPEAVRYALLTVHYRSPFHLEMDLDSAGNLAGFPQFREAEGRLEYLYGTQRRVLAFPAGRVTPSGLAASAEISQFSARLSASLDDDMNTAQAVAHLAALLKAVNELLDAGLAKKTTVSVSAFDAVQAALERSRAILGLGSDPPGDFLARVRARRAQRLGVSEAWVLERIAARASAREARDFAQADGVRAELTERGVELLDSPDGTDWRLASPS
jgi:cysteinyl-tRNA synthetase